jgi:hypothetical protein
VAVPVSSRATLATPRWSSKRVTTPDAGAPFASRTVVVKIAAVWLPTGPETTASEVRVGIGAFCPAAASPEKSATPMKGKASAHEVFSHPESAHLNCAVWRLPICFVTRSQPLLEECVAA